MFNRLFFHFNEAKPKFNTIINVIGIVLSELIKSGFFRH